MVYFEQESEHEFENESVVTSATEGEGGYVFTPFCLFVCLSVYRISQKVVDVSG